MWYVAPLEFKGFKKSQIHRTDLVTSDVYNLNDEVYTLEARKSQSHRTDLANPIARATRTLSLAL